MATFKDWIALLEASYDLESNAQEWLDGLVQRVVPLIDRPSSPVSLFTYRCTPTTFCIDDVAVHGPPIIATAVRSTNAAASEAEIDLIYRSGIPGGTLSEHVFPVSPGAREMFLEKTGGQFRDTFGCIAHTGTDRALMINATLVAEETSTAARRRRWSRVAAHLGAGLRLRSSLAASDLGSDRVEAIFGANGSLVEARHEATQASARLRLQQAVLAMDRARTRSARQDPDDAMGAWEALIQGRWSLVDRFDSDGKRFILAVRNDPAHADPRGLTQHERQVCEFLGLGLNSKSIAYTLGISASSVDNATGRVAAKLGLATRHELCAFFSPAGARAKLAEVAVSGEQLLVGAYPLVDESAVASLSTAERAVVALLVLGSTNAHIATLRGCTERTVANQVQSIFRKLEARSRSELALRLQAAR